MKYIFNPKSVAVIGATDRQKSVGRGLVENLLEEKSRRKIYLVNPFRKKVLGLKTYPNINSIKGKIDLAVIAVPAKNVFKVVKECAKKKVKGIIIISAGFTETGRQGEKLQNMISKFLEKEKIPLIGPNCLGILNPSVKLNASFAPASPKAGGIAFLSQSGALINSVISQSLNENYGFSSIVSYGNEAGLELSDFLKLAGKDKKTKVIVLYLEGVKNGKKFFEIAKEVSQLKPIIVLKGGKSKAAQKVVSSHTGSLSGEKEIYSAVFKQAGLIEVESLEELFDSARLLSWQNKFKGKIGIITNAGGAGVLTIDYCQKLGLELAKLSSGVKKKMNSSRIMHHSWSKENPVDIVGDALADRYSLAVNSLLKQKDISALMVIQTLQIMTEPIKNAKILVEAKKKYPGKAIVAAFMGNDRRAIGILEKNKIPNYSDPLRAVKALKALNI